MSEYIPPIQYGLISIVSLVIAFSHFSYDKDINIETETENETSSPNTDPIVTDTIQDDLPKENDELPTKVDDSGNDNIVNTVTSSVTNVTDTIKDKLINPFVTSKPEDNNKVNESLPIAIARPVQSGGKKRRKSMRKKNKKHNKLNHTKNSKIKN
jgi:hypothetical protein